MSIEEYREATDDLCNGKMTLQDYWELTKGWEIDDVHEFLHTKGSRLKTKNMRLKKESDVRYTMLHLIHGSLRLNDSGISLGTLDFGYVEREKRRREKKRRSED